MIARLYKYFIRKLYNIDYDWIPYVYIAAVSLIQKKPQPPETTGVIKRQIWGILKHTSTTQ